MKPIIVEPVVYVLQLEDEKIYVGITYNFNLRYAQHLCGQGAKWTRLHRPLHVLEIHPAGSYELENAKTKEFMDRCGWDNVRGGYWCQIKYRERPAKSLQKESPASSA